jgi:hypothetical protein
MMYAISQNISSAMFCSVAKTLKEYHVRNKAGTGSSIFGLSTNKNSRTYNLWFKFDVVIFLSFKASYQHCKEVNRAFNQTTIGLLSGGKKLCSLPGTCL